MVMFDEQRAPLPARVNVARVGAIRVGYSPQDVGDFTPAGGGTATSGVVYREPQQSTNTGTVPAWGEGGDEGGVDESA